MYSLYREDGVVGDSGSFSLLLWEENGELKTEHDAEPRVGTCIRVGSNYARTMQWQDWWQTSYIQEILKRELIDDVLTIKFRTKNSVYTWKAYD